MVTINRENKQNDVKESYTPKENIKDEVAQNVISPSLAKILKDLEDYEAGMHQALTDKEFMSLLPNDQHRENYKNVLQDNIDRLNKELQAFIDDPLNEKALNNEIKELLAKKGIAIKDPEFIAKTLTKTAQDIITPAIKRVSIDMKRLSQNFDELDMAEIKKIRKELIAELDQTCKSLDESKGSTSKQIFEQLKKADGGTDAKDHQKYEKFAEEITDKKSNLLLKAIKKIQDGINSIFNGLKSIFQIKEQQATKENPQAKTETKGNSKEKEENQPRKSWVAEEKKRENTPKDLNRSK